MSRAWEGVVADFHIILEGVPVIWTEDVLQMEEVIRRYIGEMDSINTLEKNRRKLEGDE